MNPNKPQTANFKLGAAIGLMGLLVLAANATLSADPPSGQPSPAPTKEQREKMATVHEQMAACLRSDKPVADCHKEAMKSCQDVMGKNGCPMMGGMHDHMMHGQAPKPKG